MDNKVVNYALMVIIVLILAYFFKAMISKTTGKVTSAAKTLVPNFEFIYV
tara:strand:+ start:219 stop:368 length:150 start_codon:yes stop_codon:yes gene_type:complete